MYPQEGVTGFATTKESNSVVAATPSLQPSAERYGLWPAVCGMAEAMPLTKQCLSKLFAQPYFIPGAV
jgi:hypothetical protein